MAKGADKDRDESLDRAWEEREMRQLTDQLGPIFHRHGHGKVAPSPVAATESRRVEALIERDRSERRLDAFRKAAEVEVARDIFVNLADTVVPPTPEWLAKGNTQTFRPKQPKGTVRTISTVRRTATPIVMRMFIAGKLNDEQYASSLWYRKTHEIAGLEGRYSGSRYDLSGGGGTSTPGSAGHMAATEFEAAARQIFRGAQSAIPSHLLKMFDAVVLSDIPIRRAARFVRCSNNTAMSKFRQAIEALAGFCREHKIDLVTGRSGDGR